MTRDKVIYIDNDGNKLTGFAILADDENPKMTDYVYCKTLFGNEFILDTSKIVDVIK